MSLKRETAALGSGPGFATTSWSLVLSAHTNEDGGVALDRLCRRYWLPTYVYIRRTGLAPADAEDATQDFFAYILARSWLDQTGEDRGSFRGYLLALLRHFLANRRRMNAAQRRGGPPISPPSGLPELEQIAAPEADPSLAYERAWARCVTQSAVEKLAEEQVQAGSARRFHALRSYLTVPLKPADLDRIAQELSEPRNRLSVYLHRLKRRYGQLIRTEVLDTVSDPREIDAELRRLVQVLSVAA